MKIKFALLIFAVNLVLHLSLIGHYPVSWDFHYHLYAGLYHLGLPVPGSGEPSNIPYTPPDPRTTIEDPFGPFTQIIPSLSYVLFFQKLKLLPFDAAYNLPMVIFGSLGPALLFIFLYDLSGFLGALFGALYLSLLPVHFGYLHTNMKDVPNAFAFALSVYTFWRLEQYRRLRDLFFAVLSFAFAFNFKINSVMVPVVCGVWYALQSVKIRRGIPSGILRSTKHEIRNNIEIQKEENSKHFENSNLKHSNMFRISSFEFRISFIILLYFVLAPLAAIGLWWPFWRNPLAKLLELPFFYSHNTLNMPVLFRGEIFRSGINIPPIYPYYYLAVTTPIPVLLTFIIGSVYIIYTGMKKNTSLILLLIWFFIPLARYINPRTGAIDGVRHFMEIVYPLTAIAAIGSKVVFGYLVKKDKTKNISIIIWAGVVFVLIKNIVNYHPYETSFFNSFIGGIRGAQGQLDIDFWGTPQKEAVDWLNKNAPPAASIHMVMAPSSAAVYLRPDLQENVNKEEIAESDFVVILNRESFFTVYKVKEYLKSARKEGRVVYTRTVNEVPLVWVVKKNGTAS